jgi:hypothetical protein
MRSLFAAPLILAMLAPLQAGPILQNGDFSQAKAHWAGPGDVIYTDASGTPVDGKDGAAGRYVEIKLRRDQWVILEQKLLPAKDTAPLKVAFELQALPDYAPAAESHEYSTEAVDWHMGGWYVWSALVFPKADFVARLTDNSWHYAPRKLAADGQWHPFSIAFDDLKQKDHTLAFTFPPGDGTVRLRNVNQN